MMLPECVYEVSRECRDIWWAYLIFGFIIYKILDWLIRIPMHQGPNHPTDFKNVKIILITGCDSGFGKRLAIRLDALRFGVFASCTTEDGMKALSRRCSRVRMFPFLMDVTDINSVEKSYQIVKDRIPEEFGLWAIVNNAGVMGTRMGPSEWLKSSDFKAVSDVNIFGMINVTNTFLPLVKKTRGRIINTASIAGRIGTAGAGPYTVSKWAVEGYSEVLRRELRPFGVSVHILEPGLFPTQMTETEKFKKAIQNAWDEVPDDLKQDYGEDYIKSVFASMEENLSRLRHSSIDPVVSTYLHAILGRFPRARYMIGWETKFVIWPLTLMPEWLSDCLFAMLNKADLPAACKKTN